ncbi:MAG: T9SS type A sorting domain-containing protein [Flavobacteriales bacterium]
MIQLNATNRFKVVLMIAFVLGPVISFSQVLSWVHGIGSPVYEEARGIVAGPNGNVYITGEFSDTVDFDPGPGTYELISQGYTDAFVACYANNGEFKWAIGMGGALDSQGYGITITPDGRVLATGIFNGSIDLDPGPGTLNKVSGGFYDVYLCSFDLEGNLQWGMTIGGPYNEETRSVSSDEEGNAYIVGEISGAFDADPGPGVTMVDSHGSFDGMVAKYSPTGALVWAQAIGGAGDDRAYDVAVNGGSNVYITGYFADSVDFDAGPDVHSYFAPNTWSNGFLLCLQQDGTFQWAANMGGDGTDSGRGVAIGPDGNVVVTGRFAKVMVLGSGANADTLTCTIPTGADADFFIAKYQPDGELVWGEGIGGPEENMPRGITTDTQGNIIVTGRTRATIDLDPGPGEALFTAAGEFDLFLGKYDPDGNYIWGFIVGDTYHERGLNVATDNAGSIFLTGWFTESPDFDPGPGSVVLTAGYVDAFIAKYSDAPLLPLTLDVALDAQPLDVSWELAELDGGEILFTGQGKVDQADQHVLSNWEVPEGCYRLSVQDAGNNGITSTGYELRNGAAPIILANGQFLSNSAIADEQGFCLPLGEGALAESTCSEYLLLPSSTLTLLPVANAGSYDIWLYDPHGTFSMVVNSTSDQMQVWGLPAGIPANLDLDVRVRAIVDGEALPYGPTCIIKLEQGSAVSGTPSDGFFLAPNPCHGGTWVGIPEGTGDVSLLVRDALGRVLLERRMDGAGVRSLDVSGLAAGSYLLEFQTSTGVRSMKLVVE